MGGGEINLKKSVERAREGAGERERGMQAAGLCLSVLHREPTVLDYSYMHTHTHTAQ